MKALLWFTIGFFVGGGTIGAYKDMTMKAIDTGAKAYEQAKPLIEQSKPYVEKAIQQSTK